MAKGRPGGFYLGAYAVKARSRWAAAEDQLLIELIEQGLRFSKIVARLPHRTRAAIYQRWHNIQHRPLRKADPPAPIDYSGVMVGYPAKPDAKKTFCTQCDSLVFRAQAANCRSRFCPVSE